MGWDEVSIKLYDTLSRSDASWCRKFALAYVCWSRWVVQILGLLGGLVLPVLMYVYPELSRCGDATHILQMAMLCLFLLFAASIFMEAVCQSDHRGVQSWIQVIFVVLYLSTGFLMAAFQAGLTILSLYKITSGNIGGWAVTERKPRSGTQTFELMDVEAQPFESACLSNAELMRIPLANDNEMADIPTPNRNRINSDVSTVECAIDGL